jgi:hypothetical protein
MPQVCRSYFTAVAATAVAAMLATPAGAALIMHKDLPLDIAKAIARRAAPSPEGRRPSSHRPFILRGRFATASG